MLRKKHLLIVGAVAAGVTFGLSLYCLFAGVPGGLCLMGLIGSGAFLWAFFKANWGKQGSGDRIQGSGNRVQGSGGGCMK